MSDKDLVNFLIAQAGSAKLAARDLGVSKQRLFNWRTRGISFRYRPAFLTVANRHGANLPLTWLDVSVPSVLEEEQDQPRSTTDGRESPRKRAQKAQGSKRKGPQQPSRAA
jgi:hypothetical protein